MNRIRQLREERGMTQPELGKVLNIQGAAMSKYENEKIDLTAQTIEILADFFGVSTDYLLGKSDDRNIKQNESKSSENEQEYFFFFFDSLLKDVFSSRYAELLNQKGLSLDDFSNACGIDSEQCQRYLRGECEPSLEDLISIAQALETTTDYLLGQTPKVTYYESKILNPFVKLNQDNKDILIGRAKELLREQEQELSVAADGSHLGKASGK